MDSVPDHVTRKIREPGGFQHGWQHEAASRIERHFRDRNLMPRLAEHEMALLRSQSGPNAGMALSVAPASFLTRIDSALFRVLLLRRLRLPLPLSRPLDSFGHHRAACSRAGVLGRRGFSVERERSCQSLPRSRRASDPQHDGHGLGCSARPRHQTAGSCRRLFATVWWHTTGHRHDFGVHVAL